LTDHDVMARAEAEERVLITEDKDFGQLAFAAGAGAAGCLLLRYPAGARSSIGADVVQVALAFGPRLSGSFVTAEPGRIRITRLPRSS
jgi:predicted nuclease of predicted toxin-antitoxin system